MKMNKEMSKNDPMNVTVSKPALIQVWRINVLKYLFQLYFTQMVNNVVIYCIYKHYNVSTLDLKVVVFLTLKLYTFIQLHKVFQEL